ncbi:MAG: crotonobetaine/carnitine-CoA ligase [Slackia sp.]|nr:crotonobetaine/carnitine-CoA ligase [Slackia sp.]
MTSIVGGETLRDLWERLVIERGDRLFLAYQSKEGLKRSFTYAEFGRLIDATANYLASLGVGKHSRVAVQLYNCPEHISVAFALAKLGAIAVPINMQHKREECAFVYDKCGIEIAVVEPDCQSYYLEAAAAAEPSDCDCCGVPSVYPMRHVLVSHAAGATLYDGAVDFDAAVREASCEAPAPCDIDTHDTAMIIFTSGTTSCPKGVELTHANMLFSGYYGDWQCGLTPDDRLLTTMPAFHSNFQTAALMPVLTAGATLVYIEKYSARRYWRQVREYGATAIQLVAMMARTMMMQPVDPEERNHRVHSVQYYLAIGDDEKEAFEKRFDVRLQNCYGATESVCWVLTDLPYGRRAWPSVGRAGLGYEVDIVDGAGNSAPAGELGEIVVRGVPGETLMKGYYRDPDATAKAMTVDGRYRTGDKGYRDEDGWFYFVDRKSNMIKRAGENISASEVEGVLLDHPAIAEAAVIGVDDPVRDQAVKAFVVFDDGAVATAADITAYCACRLADFKVPTIMEIVDGLPHTSVGKVAKKLLH